MLGTDVVVSVLTIIRRGWTRKRVVKIRRVSVWIFLKRDFLGASQCSTHTLLRIYTLIAKHRVVIRELSHPAWVQVYTRIAAFCRPCVVSQFDHGAREVCNENVLCAVRFSIYNLRNTSFTSVMRQFPTSSLLTSHEYKRLKNEMICSRPWLHASTSTASVVPNYLPSASK